MPVEKRLLATMRALQRYFETIAIRTAAPAVPYRGILPPPVTQLFGKAYAMVSAVADSIDTEELPAATKQMNIIVNEQLVSTNRDAEKIHCPVSVLCGSEIEGPRCCPAGNAFDAIITVGRVLAAAKQ